MGLVYPEKRHFSEHVNVLYDLCSARILKLTASHFNLWIDVFGPICGVTAKKKKMNLMHFLLASRH